MTEAHVAGHSTHFLRRLDRVADDHVELALTLYRDAELLREVLGRAKLPDGAERVALSLSSEKIPPGAIAPGPYVVVTRQGRFVTCLGADMSPGDLHVVGRERISVAAASVERMRERLAQIDTLDPEDRQSTRLFTLPQTCGPQLPREDFVALARWEPLLGRSFLEALTKTASGLLGRAQYIAGKRADKLRGEGPLVRIWWNELWAASHLHVLSHVGEARERARGLAKLMPDDEARQSIATITVSPAMLGMVQHAMRAGWAAARHGTDLLPALKRRPEHTDITSRLSRDIGLSAIALASARARAEAERAVGASPDPLEPEEIEADRIWREQVVPMFRAAITLGCEAGTAAFDESARATVAIWCESPALREAMPAGHHGIDDVPVDVLRALIASLDRPIIDGPSDWLSDLIGALPWVARADASELFLPRAWCGWAQDEYSDELAIATARAIVFEDPDAPVSAPVRVGPKTGRNDPCPCGSGKKYKRCCAK